METAAQTTKATLKELRKARARKAGKGACWLLAAGAVVGTSVVGAPIAAALGVSAGIVGGIAGAAGGAGAGYGVNKMLKRSRKNEEHEQDQRLGLEPAVPWDYRFF